jgi:hypothetical protein
MSASYVCCDRYSSHSSIEIKRRSGCKKVLLPNSETAKPKTWDTNATTLQLVLVRGFGDYPTA